MRGYIQREYRFNCGGDGCCCVYRYEAKNIAEGRREARKAGWSRSDKRGWVCPLCNREKAALKKKAARLQERVAALDYGE